MSAWLRVVHESIDEMRHAHKLIDRILVLNGLSNVQDMRKILVGENAREALSGDLQFEMFAYPALKQIGDAPAS